MSRSLLRRRLLLAVASFLFALLLAEVGFRVKAWNDDRSTLAEMLAFYDKVKLEPGQPVVPEGSVRPSANDSIVYELRPSMDDVIIPAQGVRLSTNSHGFRSPEIPVAKPEGTVRLVGIGDSVLFGWKLPQDQDCLAQLTGLLRSRHPERAWEHVNTAVFGYNTVMEVETLRAKGLAFSPDVVLLSIVGNDTELPNFIRETHDYFTWKKSFLWTFVGERLGWIEAPPPDMRKAPRYLAAAPRAETTEETKGFPPGYQSDPSRVPARYRHLVGWAALEGALDDLAAMAKSYGFDVVVVSFQDGWPAEARILRAAEARGFATVSVRPLLQAYMEKHGIEEFHTSPLVVAKWDPHPSAIANGIAAQALYECLKARGILARLLR